MAEKLLKYYHYIGELKGLDGKIKLAQVTKIPSPKAAIEPDSLENVQLIKKAIEQITGKSAPMF